MFRTEWNATKADKWHCSKHTNSRRVNRNAVINQTEIWRLPLSNEKITLRYVAHAVEKPTHQLFHSTPCSIYLSVYRFLTGLSYLSAFTCTEPVSVKSPCSVRQRALGIFFVFISTPHIHRLHCLATARHAERCLTRLVGALVAAAADCAAGRRQTRVAESAVASSPVTQTVRWQQSVTEREERSCHLAAATQLKYNSACWQRAPCDDDLSPSTSSLTSAS